MIRGRVYAGPQCGVRAARRRRVPSPDPVASKQATKPDKSFNGRETCGPGNIPGLKSLSRELKGTLTARLTIDAAQSGETCRGPASVLSRRACEGAGATRISGSVN